MSDESYVKADPSLIALTRAQLGMTSGLGLFNGEEEIGDRG